jgi:YYY domain-containing protein
MIFDWLAREGGIVLSWWLLVTIAGLAALPLCMRLLGGLPDKGYTLARAAGVLLVAFIYWLLAILGFLRNSTGGMLLAWAIVLIIALIAFWRGDKIDLRAWWRENRGVIIVGELLFIGLLFGWALFRAHQNGLVATEKPMELAFISSTMRSEAFPPNDPWMAGYSISYYYLGYVIAAMLGMLSGITSTITFNMLVAFLFALTGLTAFGVVYNMARAARREGSPVRSLLTGLLGAVFVILLSNYQLPLIELPYQTGIASPEYLTAMDAEERLEPRPAAANELNQWDYWWFFRAARVLNDRNLDGTRTEVIDEFPQFSFLLADNHPHVLALPFAILALGLSLNVVLTKRRSTRSEVVFYAVCLGGLVFLNTWDGPIYMAVLVGADGVRRLITNGSGRLSLRDLGSMALLGLALVGLAVVFYFPFLASFRSQLGGILPNLVYPTRIQQFFTAFAPLIILNAFFLAAEAWRAGKRMNWRFGFETALIVLWLLIMAMLLMAIIGWFIPDLRNSVLGFIEQSGGWSEVLPDLLEKRLTHIFTALLLVLGLAFVVGRLFPRILRPDADATDEERQVVTYTPSTGFALLLIGMGILLTLIPEFVYLRDNFGTRMNTVFKFYYQAWAMWSIAAAYGMHAIFSVVEDRPLAPAFKAVFGGVAALTIGLGLLYPILGVNYRTTIETGRASALTLEPLTLDGGYTTSSPDDYAATLCLGQLVHGDDAVVVSRVGGSYDIGIPPTGLSGRLVGIPNLINWPGHQSQWRGNTYYEIAGSRESDVDALYRDPNWFTAEDIINRYGIDYIFFGDAEHSEYGLDSETKFRDRLPIVCESGNSRFYSTETLATDTVQG